MKFRFAILALVLGLSNASHAQTATVTGVDDNGFAGVYNIDGIDFWWMCAEPNGSPNPANGAQYTANLFSFTNGWDEQNTTRFEYYNVTNPGYQTSVIPRQVAVMQYVLDNYLPWDTLAGASGRFIEQDSNSALYDNNTTFYNSIFAVQNFISEMYGKEAQTDFSDLSNFVDNWDGDVDPTGAARSAYFQTILNDVEGLGSGFWDTYTPEQQYYMASFQGVEGDPGNWQDVLVIGLVPEPSGALLIACTGLTVMLRRFRRTAR